MRVMQYYLFKSLSLLPPPPAVCNKAKELTQRPQTARICLIILCAIILSLLLTHSSLSVFGHRQTLSLLLQWYEPGSNVPLSLLTLSLTLSKFEFLLEGGNLLAQIAPNSQL